jgi:hypothetical protein
LNFLRQRSQRQSETALAAPKENRAEAMIDHLPFFHFHSASHSFKKFKIEVISSTKNSGLKKVNKTIDNV